MEFIYKCIDAKACECWSKWGVPSNRNTDLTSIKKRGRKNEDWLEILLDCSKFQGVFV